MKKIITLQGVKGVGKTEAIKTLYNKLTQFYKLEINVPNSPNRTKELVTIIKIGNVIIGICSYGDSEDFLKPHLDLFYKHNCNLIVCACRTNGSSSYNMVRDFEAFGYSTQFIEVLGISDQTVKILGNHIYHALNERIIDNVKNLKNQGILIERKTKDNQMYQLATPSKVMFPKKIVEEFNSEYKPDEEKGGFILFRPTYKNDLITLTAERIQWIVNVSNDKRNSYRIKTPEHNTSEFYAWDNGLLPMAFHTHPEPGETDIMKSLTMMNSLNTSSADKKVSEYGYNTGESKLLLPDVLVVGGVNHNGSVFIGLYNGGITPMDFASHQKKLANNSLSDVAKKVDDWADTPGKQFALFVSAIAAIFLAVKYPKVSIPLLAGAAATVPLVSMSHRPVNNFFGITSISDFAITIPEVTEEIIAENQKILGQIEEEQKKLLSVRPA